MGIDIKNFFLPNAVTLFCDFSGEGLLCFDKKKGIWEVSGGFVKIWKGYAHKPGIEGGAESVFAREERKRGARRLPDPGMPLRRVLVERVLKKLLG